MRFSALPVIEGDSFLLDEDGKYILVDGGRRRAKIVKLLDSECIPNKHINIIICTHYDSDHIDGIIDILDSRKYTFDELWLPEVLASLSYTLSEKLREILDYLRRQEDVVDNFEIDSLSDLPYTENIESINEKQKKHLINFVKKCNRIEFRKEKYSEELNNIFSALSMVSSAIKSCSKVRWFTFTNNLEDFQCGNDMVSKNAIETGITIYSTPKIFFNALSLTVKNKESLVYLYDNDNLPNVLFTADSDLSFTKFPIKLKKNSIVTTPHHGSDANKKAYSKISGENIYYVRSDKKQIKRPCAEYLLLPNRFCTICRDKIPHKKVVIECVNGITNTLSKKCIC